jgi:hypothetical protein
MRSPKPFLMSLYFFLFFYTTVFQMLKNAVKAQ